MTMNFELSQVPSRSIKPRENGLTMVMDKGLSLRETEDFISSSGEFTDLVKLGFGSSLITPNLDKKSLYIKKPGYRSTLAEHC